MYAVRILYNFYRKETLKSGIAICSKSLSILQDTSLKFIEWIEMLRSLKVDKIILYVLAVHPNVKKVGYCQAQVRSPKVQSPKVKTKGTWADTIIT